MRRFLSWLILLWVVVAMPVSGLASVDEDIPIDSWIYPAINELSAGGDGPSWLLFSQPYTRGQLAFYLHGLAPDSSRLDAGQQIIFRRLFYEFRQDIDELHQPVGEESVLRAGLQPYALTTQTEDRRAVNHGGGYAFVSYGESGSWVAHSRLRLDSDARFDTRFRGEPWKDNLTANLDNASIKLRRGNFEAFWGRGWLKFGRSAEDGLLLSGFSPPFDYGRLSYRKGPVVFQYFIARLDDLILPADSGVARRYLAGHRIDVRLSSFLELAATEVVVFGGVDRSLEWYYLNPLIPYYWEQLNEDHDDNPLWNFEWSLFFARGWEFYGELLIDDFQIDFISEPHQLGILTGLHAVAPLGLARSFHTIEYSRVSTTVYGQNEPHNRYYYRRDMNHQVIPLGSRYGPDVERMTYRMKYHATDWLDLLFSAERIWSGERKIDDPQQSGVEHGVPFPSGVVDRRFNLTAGFDFQYKNLIFAHLTGGWSQRENEFNLVGNDADLLVAEGVIRVNLWRVFRWPK